MWMVVCGFESMARAHTSKHTLLASRSLRCVARARDFYEWKAATHTQTLEFRRPLFVRVCDNNVPHSIARQIENTKSAEHANTRLIFVYYIHIFFFFGGGERKSIDTCGSVFRGRGGVGVQSMRPRVACIISSERHPMIIIMSTTST